MLPVRESPISCNNLRAMFRRLERFCAVVKSNAPWSNLFRIISLLTVWRRRSCDRRVNCKHSLADGIAY